MNIPEIYGSLVFNDKVMRERLPKDVYKKLKNTIKNSRHLDIDIANIVANAMKEWAIENGATHYTHWFQPMTGITAEKHDSFINPDGNGNVVMEFSGKELVKGEPDASSFPSGGLRETYEARGYTAWDPSSYAFIKDGTLCIPTAFCSYSGESLDKKTPLLRSMDALDRQAKRVLKLFGHDDVKRVVTTVGPEQEYFLVDIDTYLKRPDLIFTGRTLFGARPPKGQELDDHYFGVLKSRVSAFMKELDEELWKLGIAAKTKHNEVAPAQHELAPVFSTTNIATDHNQLTMEMMRKIAYKHGMACLLHEKPFDGVNGSGKHNNWSLSTQAGKNLLDPGETPYENAQFLVFLTAVIKAVDDYQGLMRASVASAGNDHRLGADEAPPAIVSIFVGDELGAILDSIEKGVIYHGTEPVEMEIGASVLPKFPQDTTDRNRTSPFAFTGNRFEFRMLGSALSISGPNVVLNTAVAEALRQIADELEAADNFNDAVLKIVQRHLNHHKKIIFNGNGYSAEWEKEAEERGLLNLKSTPDALPYYVKPESIKLFTDHGVFTETELRSRYDVYLENYSKVINIEALTMVDMVKKFVLSAVSKYQRSLIDTLKEKKELSLPCDMEQELVQKIAALSDEMYVRLGKLEEAIEGEKTAGTGLDLTRYSHDVILMAMQNLRETVDELESLVATDFWPLPTYSEMLFSII